MTRSIVYESKTAYTGQNASSKRTGSVRFATAAEALAGTSTNTAVTPATAVTAIPDATTAIKGKVALATNAETITGTNTTKAITPDDFKAGLASPPAIGGTAAAAINGTTLTATTGNLVTSTAGKGILLNSPTGTRAGTGSVTINGRSGQATITAFSLAAAADLTVTIASTTAGITSSSQIMVTLSGATTGSALSVKAVTPGTNTFDVVITNGTGATTSTANLVITFIVLN